MRTVVTERRQYLSKRLGVKWTLGAAGKFLFRLNCAKEDAFFTFLHATYMV